MNLEKQSKYGNKLERIRHQKVMLFKKVDLRIKSRKEINQLTQIV